MNEKPDPPDLDFGDELTEKFGLPVLRKTGPSRAFGDLLRVSAEPGPGSPGLDFEDKLTEKLGLPSVRNVCGANAFGDLIEQMRQIAGVTGFVEQENAFQERLSVFKKTKKAVEKPQPARLDMREVYHKSPEGTLRKEWSQKLQKGELGWSGLPTYIQKLVEGQEEEHEKEMGKYCRLAGLRYKTSRESLKEKTKAAKDEIYTAILQVTEKLEKLVDSYNKLEAF